MPQSGIQTELAQQQQARAQGTQSPAEAQAQVAPAPVAPPQAAPQPITIQSGPVANPDAFITQLMQQQVGLPPGNQPVTPDTNAILNQGLPGHERNLQQAQPATPGTPQTPPEPQAPVVATIGDRNFTDVTEAMKYANELHQAKATDDAFIDGVKHATPQAPAAGHSDRAPITLSTSSPRRGSGSCPGGPPPSPPVAGTHCFRTSPGFAWTR